MAQLKDYLVDSDVLIDYLRGLDGAQSFLLKLQESGTLWVSTINIMEIYSGEDIKEEEKRKAIDSFLDDFAKIELDTKKAKRGGRIRLEYGVPFADAAIAATCLEDSLILVSKNKKHFQRVEGLEMRIPGY